jgi:DNA-binding MarR family transcriptional regulator
MFIICDILCYIKYDNNLGENIMTDNKNDSELLKAIIKADLSQSDLKILHHLMKKPEKTILSSHSKLAGEIGMAQPNFVRSIKKMKEASVIGKRGNGIFIKSKSVWNSKK